MATYVKILRPGQQQTAPLTIPSRIDGLQVGPVKTYFCDRCDLFFEIFGEKISVDGFDGKTGKAYFDGLTIVEKSSVVSAIRALVGKEDISQGEGSVTYSNKPGGSVGLSGDGVFLDLEHSCEMTIEQKTDFITRHVVAQSAAQGRSLSSLIFNPETRTIVPITVKPEEAVEQITVTTTYHAK